MEFLNTNNNSSTSVPGGNCSDAVTQVANIAIHMVGFMITVFLCNCLHLLLRRFSQPRIISESIVGLTMSNIPFVRKHIGEEINSTLNYLVDFGMVCHMFVVGLEIDPNIFIHIPLHEAKISTSSFLTTLVLAFGIIPFLNITQNGTIAFTFVLSIVISGTNSPVLTRIITDLKIGKSDIGKLVVGAGIHSDVVFTLIISIGFIFFDNSKSFGAQTSKKIAQVSITLVVQYVAGKKLTPYVMNWVNGQNPEGKPMKGSHLVLSIAYVIILCSLPNYFNYDKVLGAFMAGFSMPREGRISKLMVNKGNYFFSAIFYPLFFLYVGTQLPISQFEAGKIRSWVIMLSLYLIGIVGKITGSVICGVMMGFHWPESMAIGMLLNTKGRFQLYLAAAASEHKLVSPTTAISIVIVVLISIALKPLVVAKVITRARKRAPIQRRALQWQNVTSELSILLCIHGPQNILSAINLMEISRGSLEPGIMVYLTEMIELTDKIAESLTYNGGGSSVTVTDPVVVESRERTSTMVQEYLDTAGKGVSVQRRLALSYFNTLHQDVAILAEDLSVSLIILPFHKLQDMDGKLVTENSSFRHVNRKILRQAPCSVGILVDRGLGTTVITRKSDPINAAVIFIGGKDDREALMFAGRLARHPGVKLTVIRFLLDIGDEDSVSTRISKGKINTSAHQEEMKLDDECFTEFYDAYVAGGMVAYLEKYLVNSGQTFSTLTTLESQYSLFIVGRDGRVNSVLTVGMNDWEQCPELGPIGDILSGSEFSTTASVLIIQQHSLKGGLDGIHDEFSIM
ncbi:transporter [Lithospermum erythrorhizon]|uniref:Transporter n=1 Tax=Lithospermum erythrorhizon TaxID=34254 RepID=A0AAV3NYQ4_LITER